MMKSIETKDRNAGFGLALLDDPTHNKGTAFTAKERAEFALEGLLPPSVESLDRQVERIMRHLEAKPTDLIVLSPWQYGISFNRYYHGRTPSITLPAISDLRVHRYDLFREKMLAEHPIADVLEKIRQTLGDRNRVWIVGGIKLPPNGQAPRDLPPARCENGVWDNVVYSDAWQEQLGVFIREHSERGQTVSLPITGPVNPFEDVSLMLVEGWQ